MPPHVAHVGAHPRETRYLAGKDRPAGAGLRPQTRAESSAYAFLGQPGTLEPFKESFPKGIPDRYLPDAQG